MWNGTRPRGLFRLRRALHRQELQLLERLRREERRLRRLRGWRQVLSHRLCRRRLRRELHGHRRVSHVRLPDRSDDDDDARADAQAQRQAQRQAYGQAHDDDDDARAAAGQEVCRSRARRVPRGLRRQLRQVLRGHHVPSPYGVWGGWEGHEGDHPHRRGRLRAPRGQLQQNLRNLPASETSVALLRLSAARREEPATTRSSS